MTKSAYIPEKIEEAILISKENKKAFFLPWGYPIRKTTEDGYQGLRGIVIILQDLIRKPLSEMSKADVYEALVHEFQSPLTEIHMAIHLCVEEASGPLTESQKELLFTAREKCDYLEKLCQDLLNLSQDNQKNQNLEHEEIDLNRIVTKLIASFQLEANQKEILIDYEEPPYLRKIKADVNQIKILISNLFRNAIHYADSGTIVKVKLREKKKFIELLVSNKGPHIPLEYHKSIFKKHFKVPGQAKERTGLGLYISKQIVRSMGGKIGFRSTEKQGTAFWIDLPIAS